MTHPTRRNLLGLLGTISVGSLTRPLWASQPDAPTQRPALPGQFPRHDMTVVREVVIASHFNVARVQELVGKQPALARASWDHGFGDWETALGAAAHTGAADIARLLLGHGAPPTIFSAAMLGQLDVVKALVTATPGILQRLGPHGISLLSHAEAGGPAAADVVAYLTQAGGANNRPTSVPLTAEERGRLVGTYQFGPGPEDVLVVAEARGSLSLTRPNYSSNNLRHVGNWTFHPSGVAAVSITFERTGDRAGSLTIADPAAVLTARYVAGISSLR